MLPKYGLTMLCDQKLWLIECGQTHRKVKNVGPKILSNDIFYFKDCFPWQFNKTLIFVYYTFVFQIKLLAPLVSSDAKITLVYGTAWSAIIILTALEKMMKMKRCVSIYFTVQQKH